MAEGARANRAFASYPRVCPSPLSRASTSYLRFTVKKTWMAGTSPAMAMWMGLVKAIVVAFVVSLSASQASAQALPGGFAYLGDIDPTIIQDIRYAGANNFMGRPLAGYGAAECVVKREVGLALKNIQRELARQKLSLKMFDCYRPARAVAAMVAWAENGPATAAQRPSNP